MYERPAPLVALSKKIGARLRTARNAAQLTQEQLADRLGTVNNRTIGNWERGERTPSLLDLVGLCDVLGIEISYFFGAQDLEDDELRLLSLFRALPSERRPSLLRYAEFEANTKPTKLVSGRRRTQPDTPPKTPGK